MYFALRDDEPATATATATDAPSQEGPHAQARRTHAPAREGETTTLSDHVKDRHADSEWPEWLVCWVSRASNTTWAQQPPTGLGDLWEQTRDTAGEQAALLTKGGIYLGGTVSWIACALIYAVTWPVSAFYGAGWLPALTDLMDAVDETAEDRTGAIVLGSAACVWTAACYGAAALAQYMSLLVTLTGCFSVAYLTTLF